MNIMRCSLMLWSLGGIGNHGREFNSPEFAENDGSLLEYLTGTWEEFRVCLSKCDT